MSQQEKFKIGKLLVTPGVSEKVEWPEMSSALQRHMDGDWGYVDQHDREENETAMRDGFRILSSYMSKDGVKFWIITEADRSATTILLPEEY